MLTINICFQDGIRRHFAYTNDDTDDQFQFQLEEREDDQPISVAHAI